MATPPEPSPAISSPTAANFWRRSGICSRISPHRKGVERHARVGVKGLRYPVVLRAADGAVQNTIAEFGMYVGLAHDVKGTHMSRFVEVLEEKRAPVDLAGF